MGLFVVKDYENRIQSKNKEKIVEVLASVGFKQIL